MKKLTSKHKVLSLLILLLSIQFAANSKNNQSSTFVDQLMFNIPDSITHSEEKIAEFINFVFSSEAEKSRAVFYWIANNISYDATNIFAFSIIRDVNEEPAGILETRKGVCHDYVLLYKKLADKVGLKTAVVTGYTKKRGRVSGNPHAWIAIQINSEWYLTDPTWGAGYLQDGEFIKKFNPTYFNVDPELFAKSHIPFDPIWQLSNFPITKQEFHSKKKRKQKNLAFFNFKDSIQKYETQPRIERLESMRNRIMANGISNYLDHDHLVHLQSKIVHHYRKLNETNYYAALNKYNKGIAVFNEFIGYKNLYFQPFKGDQAIKQMLKQTKEILEKSQSYLKQVGDLPSMAQLKNQLYQSIGKALLDLDKAKSNLHADLELARNYRTRLTQNLNTQKDK